MVAARHHHSVLAGIAVAVTLGFSAPGVAPAPASPVAPARFSTATDHPAPSPATRSAVAVAEPVTGTPVDEDPAPQGAVTVRTFLSASGAETVASTLVGPMSMTGRHYAFLTSWGQLPARWNPCAPLRWKVNYLGNRLTGELPRLKAAFADVTRATGIRFVYAGRTSAAVGRAAAGADIVVWFATLRQGASMYGSNSSANLLGVGGHTDWQLGDTYGGPLVPQRGDVAFVASKISGLTARERTNLYLHELGHVMNLGHVLDATQVMNPSMSTLSPGRFGVGDRNGLALLGIAQGCVAVPVRPAAPGFALADDDLVISAPSVASSAGPVTYVLRDAAMRTVIGRSSTPRFTITLSALLSHPLLRDAAFQVVAQNWVGQSSGASRTYELPGADLVGLPTFTATSSRITMSEAALRICGTTVETTEGLTVTGTLTVSVYQGTVATGVTFPLRGPGASMALSGFHDVRYHLSGSLTYRVQGTGSRTVDYTGVILAAT